MDLSKLITDDVNIVDAYFCPPDFDKISEMLVCGWKELPHIPIKFFKSRTDYQFTLYSYKDMTYIYDNSNDSQKVLRRQVVSNFINENVYVVAMSEETVPTHRFPCTYKLNDTQVNNNIHYKYNNRIFFHVEKDVTDRYSIFLRYHHAYNVDLDKMNQDWNFIYKILEKAIHGSTKRSPKTSHY